METIANLSVTTSPEDTSVFLNSTLNEIGYTGAHP
jgi:hypothetical protein